MAFTGPMVIKKRRVRPRIGLLDQPKDDDEKKGEYATAGEGKTGTDPSPAGPKAKL